MKKDRTVQLAQGALGIAIVFVLTRVIQFPIPFGYAHLGNAAIFFFAVYFGAAVGGIAAGFGSALADLTSFPVWTLPTLIIKTIMGILVAVIAGKSELRSARTFLAVLAGAAEMVLGYFLGGAVLYGGLAASAAQVPGLCMEGVVGIVLFYAFSAVFEKAGLKNLIRVHTAAR